MVEAPGNNELFLESISQGGMDEEEEKEANTKPKSHGRIEDSAKGENDRLEAN